MLIRFRWSTTVAGTPKIPNTNVKTTKVRWLVLAVFFLNAALNGVQYTNYIMVPDVLKEFYGISDVAITWTCLIYFISMIVMVLPLLGYLQKKSLRYTMLWGSGLLLGGAMLKERTLMYTTKLEIRVFAGSPRLL